MYKKINLLAGALLLLTACSKSSGSSGGGSGTVTPPPQYFQLSSTTINGGKTASTNYNVNTAPVIRFVFTAPIDHSSAAASITFKDNSGGAIAFTPSFANGDSTVIVQPAAALKYLVPYTIQVATSLSDHAGDKLNSASLLHFMTTIDSTDKFPRISDSALLDLVEQQTLAYFWDFGHPVSGLARERTSSGDVTTTGGSGFGIMGIIAGVSRGFISRTDALTRLQTIVQFLADPTKVTRYHGAFSHWINGATGATIPFSANDDGGDIVETSYLMQGLLCARQYFNSTTDPGEIALRTTINTLWNGVDYNWYRQNGQNVLYWNWSPNKAWAVNVQVTGWDEALITYVLAASATNPIPKNVYDAGWALNGAIANGKFYYGIKLPLGPDEGGPLFFAHYSFLGIDPRQLSDAYASYWTQDTAHARINYLYCANNPGGFYGYSNLCWGLTASDEPNGYSAHSPTNDNGVISPTAAVSSLPYTPAESMNAIRFFYYTLGDKTWGKYGFTDAFSLTSPWFDNDRIAIDQGPQIVMIENYRSGLLWNLFMSCPEVQTGMKALGFTSPHF